MCDFSRPYIPLCIYILRWRISMLLDETKINCTRYSRDIDSKQGIEWN